MPRVRTIKLEHFAGPTSASGEFEITGDFREDVANAVREDHSDHSCIPPRSLCDDASCDIREAEENGYPFIAAHLLYSATECPALDAVRFAYGLRVGGCPVDFIGAHMRDLPDSAEWFEHFERYGHRCESCESVTFGDDDGAPEQCANCLSTDLIPVSVGDYPLDKFVDGYLDAILFTESVDAAGYAGESRIEELAAEIRSAYEHGRDPQRQLCELESIQDIPGDTSLLSYGCSRDDFTEDAVSELRSDCVDFIAANRANLERYAELRGDPVRCALDSFGRTTYDAAECAGSDFWLSRNGHGAGFFDRGDDPVFRSLQDAARVYGEISVYFDGEDITT